jgi:hypothetical protein
MTRSPLRETVSLVRIRLPPPRIKISDRSAFLVSDISFLADISALSRSARRAALCTETNLGVIGLGVGLGPRVWTMNVPRPPPPAP